MSEGNLHFKKNLLRNNQIYYHNTTKDEDKQISFKQLFYCVIVPNIKSMNLPFIQWTALQIDYVTITDPGEFLYDRSEFLGKCTSFIQYYSFIRLWIWLLRNVTQNYSEVSSIGNICRSSRIETFLFFPFLNFLSINEVLHLDVSTISDKFI